MGSATGESDSIVSETMTELPVSRVSADTWNPQRIQGDHPLSLNTTW